MKLKKFNDIFPSNSLLESFKGYPYHTIVVEVKNIDELEELHIKLKEMYRMVNDLLSSCHSFPNYIFLEPNNFYSTNYADIVYLTDDKDKEPQKERHIYGNKNVDQYIYNMSEWDRIKPILKYGITKPSYAPRKKVLEHSSLLETIGVFPYRFKTEKEFIEEYGENWYADIRIAEGGSSFCWITDMDYLLGTILEENLPDDYFEEMEYFLISRKLDPERVWYITKPMLTKNEPPKPNYAPKSKRVLEGLNQYPYRFKTEEEFKEEFGRNWRNTPNPYWSRAYSGMDVLLGTVYPYTEDELNKNDRPRSEKFTDKNGHDWAIGWWMLTKNIIKPNYNPRKLYID